jgi:hypothetical protein
MERQSKEPRSLEAYCRGGQGPPWAVAPFGGGGGLALLQQLMTPQHEPYITIPSSTRWYYLVHVFPLHAKLYFI